MRRFGAVLTNTGSFSQPFKFQTKLTHSRSGSAIGAIAGMTVEPDDGWAVTESGRRAGSISMGMCSISPLDSSDPLGHDNEGPGGENAPPAGVTSEGRAVGGGNSSHM